MASHLILQVMTDGDQMNAELADFDASIAVKKLAKIVDSASVTWTIGTGGSISATAAGGPGGGLTALQALGRSAMGV